MVTLYLFIVIALPAAVGIYLAFQGLSRSRRCPACADETIPIRSGAHRFTSLVFRSTELQLRWCTSCEWQGTVRLGKGDLRLIGPPATSPTTGADQVDIRRLEIDGRQWKVLVQCWSRGDRWVGRLLFVGPDGQALAEEDSSLEGGSAIEILSSALAIPEQTLAGLIRRTIH